MSTAVLRKRWAIRKRKTSWDVKLEAQTAFASRNASVPVHCYAVFDVTRFDEFEVSGGRFLAEKALALPEHDWKGPQAKLIDQPVLHQRVDQFATAMNLQQRAIFLLQAGDF